MYSKIFRLSIISILTIFSFQAFSVDTGHRTIKSIHVKHDGTYYFTAVEGGWGASGCPSAKYVLLKSKESDVAKEILSVALSAKHAGKKVYFLGDCYILPDYYEAHSIWVL